jgi:hypothetical protein
MKELLSFHSSFIIPHSSFFLCYTAVPTPARRRSVWAVNSLQLIPLYASLKFPTHTEGICISEMMQQERRKSERVRVHLGTLWKYEQRTREGTVLDMSLQGCFIATQEAVRVGDPVEVEISVPSVLRMDLKGLVAHNIRGKGFAIRFKDVSATEQGLLQLLLKMMKQREPSPAG